MKASSLAAICGAVLLPLAATAQFFSDRSAVRICDHDNADCHPVTPGELFAVISIFTLWPWVIAFAFVLYNAFGCSTENCPCLQRGAGGDGRRGGVHGAGDAAAAGGPGDLASRSAARRGSSSPSSRGAVRGPERRSSAPGSDKEPVGGDSTSSPPHAGSVVRPAAAARGSSPVDPDVKVSASSGTGSAAEPKATDFGMARSTSLASGSGAARFADTDASPPRPFNALGGSLGLSRGTVVVATSRLAALGVTAAVSAATKVRWEVELLNTPTGPLCIGVLNSKRRPLSEARGEVVGSLEGSWAFDVAAGSSLAQTAHSGIPALETFEAEKGTRGDRFGVELDRPARKITLFKNSVPLRVELQDLPDDGLLYPALSLSGGSQVRLRLGNGWGSVGTMTGATSRPVGSLVGAGDSDV